MTDPEPRYGVYLRPDPSTCLMQAQINAVLKQQFGIVSAAAFPAHATLIGNLRTAEPLDGIISLIDRALEAKTEFTVHNRGVQRMGDVWGYDVHEDGAGKPNSHMVDLARRVIDGVASVSLPHDDTLVLPYDISTFRAHISLASHDLLVDPHFTEEVGDFLQKLPLEAPATFIADTVTLFEFSSDDWRGEWWQSLSWRHLHSWRLHPAGE